MAEAVTGNIAVPEATRPRVGLPDEHEIYARASGENFSVATRLLPRRLRGHLLAIYGYARLVDQLGDAVSGDRNRALDTLEAELDSVFAASGQPTQPVLARLRPTVQELGLPERPFRALLEANRQDQAVHRYATFAELRAYCALSANPVGELVLHVFGAATPERVALSDEVCTALQLAEHWQDVAEDYSAGRIYLPAEDLQRFTVSEAELADAHSSARLVGLLSFEVTRAASLLDAGARLVSSLQGTARLAVAGYVGGGRAALEAIERASYDVLAGPPRASKLARLRHTLASYRSGK